MISSAIAIISADNFTKPKAAHKFIVTACKEK